MNTLTTSATSTIRVYVLASTAIFEYGIVASLTHPNYPQFEPIAINDRTARISPNGSVIVKTFLGDDTRDVIATRERFPTIPMLVIGQLGRLQDASALKRAGINATLDIRATPEDLRSATLRVAMESTRSTAWRDSMTEAPERQMVQQPEMRRSGSSLSRLSTREMEILRLVQQGARNKEIAATLILSENTVKTHIQRIMAKLEVNNRTQAAMMASAVPNTRQEAALAS